VPGIEDGSGELVQYTPYHGGQQLFWFWAFWSWLSNVIAQNPVGWQVPAMRRHFLELAERSPLPIILYNIQYPAGGSPT